VALSYNTDIEAAICQVGAAYKTCKPSVRVSTATPPGWTGDPNYGLWGVANFGFEGLQCIAISMTRHTRVYGSDGSLERETNGTSSDTVCSPGELGWWPLRSDGDYWGLVLSGAISNGRMEHDGRVTLSLPNSSEPTAKNVETDYRCTVTETWSCTATPVQPPDPPVP
jgi:hypothetical protein